MTSVKKGSCVCQNVVHRERDGGYSKDGNALEDRVEIRSLSAREFFLPSRARSSTICDTPSKVSRPRQNRFHGYLCCGDASATSQPIPLPKLCWIMVRQ